MVKAVAGALTWMLGEASDEAIIQTMIQAGEEYDASLSGRTGRS